MAKFHFPRQLSDTHPYRIAGDPLDHSVSQKVLALTSRISEEVTRLLQAWPVSGLPESRMLVAGLYDISERTSALEDWNRSLQTAL
jgi:hypothetical protein